MITKRILAIPFTVLLLAHIWGCAQAVLPTPQNVDRSHIYNANYDSVWNAVIDTLAENNIPITALEKDSGIIAVQFSYAPQNANEGELGFFEQIVRRDGKLNVLVRENRLIKYMLVLTRISVPKYNGGMVQLIILLGIILERHIQTVV